MTEHLTDEIVDEELPQPALREWPRLRRARRPAGIVVVLAAVVAAAVLLVRQDGDPNHEVDAALPAAAPHVPRSFEIRVPPPDVLPDVHLGRIRSATSDIPAAVTRAVRNTFPDADDIAATSVISGGTNASARLYYRRITAQQGLVRLLIEITQAQPDERPGTVLHEDGSRSAAKITDQHAGLTVVVEVAAPPGHDLGIGRLQRLAGDVDLLVLR